MEQEILISLAKVLTELKQSVEHLNESIQLHQNRVEGLAASQVILFQILIRHADLDPADIIHEIQLHAEKTPSESTRSQLEYHLKACEQLTDMYYENGHKKTN